MATSGLQRYFRHGTLVQLRVFDAVARLRSFTRAAEEMHLAQPTVSVLIRKLTETVGAPLVEQVGKRVQLTPAGEAVAAACQRLFGTFGELDRAISDIREVKAGKLSIAATTAGEYLLPQLVAQFLALYPGIEVSLHVSSRKDIVARLAANVDDLYLLTRIPETPAVQAHAILPNPLVAVAAADHPLAAQRKIPFERFAREPLLVREPGSGTRLAAEQAFAQHALEPQTRMELGSNEAIKEMIAARLGVALMYRSALGFGLDVRRLAVLDVEGLPAESNWHFVHPVAKQLPFAARTFIDFAQREATAIFAAHAAQRAPTADAARRARGKVAS